MSRKKINPRYVIHSIQFHFICILLQDQNLDLNNVNPVKIFELMFQSPENSVGHDDAHPNGKNIFKPSSRFMLLL